VIGPSLAPIPIAFCSCCLDGWSSSRRIPVLLGEFAALHFTYWDAMLDGLDLGG